MKRVLLCGVLLVALGCGSDPKAPCTPPFNCQPDTQVAPRHLIVLTIDLVPNDGTVTFSAPGMNPITCAVDCQISLENGTGPITLFALPMVNSAFLGWTGCGIGAVGQDCVLPAQPANLTVTANFQ